MMNFDTIIGALLGVIFHEAFRIYKKQKTNKSWFPSVGIGKFGNIIVYILVLIVFSATSVFLCRYVADNNPVAAFILGMSVPEGLKTLKPVEKPDGSENIDDFWSETGTIKERLYYWLHTYFI